MNKRFSNDSKVRTAILCFVMLLLVLCSTATLLIRSVSAETSTVTWTGKAGNNLWSSPENWSTNKVPVTYESVVIIPKGVTVQADIKNTPVNLQCEGDLTINNDVMFSLSDGSTIKGHITNNGSLSFNKGVYTFKGGAEGSGSYYLNIETKIVLDGGIYVFDGDIIDIHQEASIHAESDSDVTVNGYYKTFTSIGKDAKVTFNYDNKEGNQRKTRELSIENEGTVVFNRDIVLKSLNFLSGSIESAGNITLNGDGRFKWLEGVFKGTGNFIVGRLRETKLSYKFYNFFGCIIGVASEVEVPVNDKNIDKPSEDFEILGKGSKEMNLAFMNEATVKISGGDVLFNNHVTNRGEIMLSDGTGKVTIKKDFTQEESGILSFELKSAKDYTSLHIEQTLKLNGAVNCNFINGYIPHQNASFSPLTYVKKPNSTFLYLYRNLNISLANQYDETQMKVTVSKDAVSRDTKCIKEIQINKPVSYTDTTAVVKLQQGFINDMFTSMDSKLDVNTDNSNKATIHVGKDNALIRIQKRFDGTKTFCIEMPSHDKNNTTLQFPATELRSEKGKELIKIQTDYGCLTFPLNLIKNDKVGKDAKVEINVEKVELSQLDKQTQSVVGAHPIVDIFIQLDGKPAKVNEKILVSVPYQPTSEESANPGRIVVQTIDEKGNLIAVPSGKYDAESKS
ncbi:MAG TPA: hypothetical protein DDZ89_16780, partial [Clostridiales bacterium]|nr:hypothetical protein [Clostridiales bacterium]